MGVPDDIREEALKIWRRVDEEKERYPADIIAQALLSERLAQKERDAKIAETFGTRSRSHDIAAAIRES